MKMSALDKMSVKELQELGTKVEAAIRERQAREKVELRQKMAALAREKGLTLAEVLGQPKRGGKAKDKGGSAIIKYRDPSNPDNTWTGRGRRPRWMNGVSNIEKFRIN